MRGRVVRFIDELRRRKVVGTAGIYLVGSFVAMQVVDDVFGYVPFIRNVDAAGQIVFVLLAVGFPIALGLAWFLEITPPQLRRELSQAEAAAPVAHGEEEPEANLLRSDSVAVLPFENLSNDPDNEYFSDGITEDITASVAHIQGLRVLSRMSVMRYKGVSRPVGEIAADLGVATIVTGSVRRSGSRIRVVAEVVDARRDDRLWSKTFDRELEDIFQVQSEIAANIAEAVQRELSSDDRRRIELRGTNDPEAYDLYLKARFLWNQRSEASLDDSLRYFQRALDRDAGFALAHSGLADAYTILGIYGARAPREVLESARDSADTALSVDPTLGEAIAAKACVSGILDWDWARAEEGFKRALEMTPSYATARQWYAINILTPQGRFDDAQKMLQSARELDPASRGISVSRGIVAFYARDLETATEEFEDVAKLHPRFALVHYFFGQLHALTGEYTRSVESLERAIDLSDGSSETLGALGHALALAGRAPEAEVILTRLEERSAKRYVSPALLAQVLIGLRRTEAAIDRLEEATQIRATDLIWIGVRPVYDALAPLPRFQAIVDELGLTRGR